MVGRRLLLLAAHRLGRHLLANSIVLTLLDCMCEATGSAWLISYCASMHDAGYAPTCGKGSKQPPARPCAHRWPCPPRSSQPAPLAPDACIHDTHFILHAKTARPTLRASLAMSSALISASASGGMTPAATRPRRSGLDLSFRLKTTVRICCVCVCVVCVVCAVCTRCDDSWAQIPAPPQTKHQAGGKSWIRSSLPPPLF